MHARLLQFHILPGKMDEFTTSLQSLIPLMHEQKGFRGLLVLRADAGSKPEAQVISLWDSLQDLLASENSMYFYQGISRVLGCAEGFPSIREQEVLVSEFSPALPRHFEA